MVTHDPIAASYTDRVVFLADGKVVDELREPNADRVLEEMKILSARYAAPAHPILPEQAGPAPIEG